MFPDGRRVVSASYDSTLKVWDVATGECVATLEGHSECVRCGVHCTFAMIWLRRRSIGVAVFPDGRRVVSGSLDKTLKVWDVETGECVATLEGHSSGWRCGVHCTFVMMCLGCRSEALPCLRTGGASCLGRRTRHAGVGGAEAELPRTPELHHAQKFRPSGSARRRSGVNSKAVAPSQSAASVQGSSARGVMRKAALYHDAPTPSASSFTIRCHVSLDAAWTPASTAEQP